MYILHIETSTAICSVALSNGDLLLGVQDSKEGMNHTALLTPSIDRLLKSSSISPGDLAAVAISSGPGSYTGLRVGSSTAKAMAYSLGIPLIAVPTLQALARATFDRYPEADFALPMIDARRMEVYTSIYNRHLEEILPVSSVILDEAFFRNVLSADGNFVSCGDGSWKIDTLGILASNLTVDATLECSAKHMIPLAFELYERRSFQDPLHFVPYYLKPPNITEPKKAGFIRQ